MSWCRVIVAVAVLGSVSRVLAAPLDLIPPAATLVVAVDNPRNLVAAAVSLSAYQSAIDAIPAVREALDTTPSRRFFQFVAFAEKELGAPWPELLDRVAGGGLALAVKTDPESAPALLVIRGTNESAVADAYSLLIRLVAEEEARQLGAKGPRSGDYRGTRTDHIGEEFHAARVGSVMFLANAEAALHAGLDQSHRGQPAPIWIHARKLIGPEPLAWLGFDLATAKQTQSAQDFYENSRKDLFQTLVAGGTIDALRRADFLTTALHRTADGFTVTTRLPVKRADLLPELAFHLPAGDAPGSLPLLEPPGVVYSQSFCLDLGRMWADRAKVINGQQIQDIEKGLKDVSRFLPGTSLEKLLAQSGSYHRVVVVADDPHPNPYPAKPVTPVPPFAVVSSFRDAEFAKGATTALRLAGLLFSAQEKVTLREETQDGVTIISYRYPDQSPAPNGDPENFRFNFLPSFAIVDRSLVLASRPSLIKALIPELRKDHAPGDWSPAVWRSRTYAPGLAALIRANPDPLVANAVLTEGVGWEAARRQLETLADWVSSLGTVDVTVEHKSDVFEATLSWATK